MSNKVRTSSKPTSSNMNWHVYGIRYNMPKRIFLLSGPTFLFLSESRLAKNFITRQDGCQVYVHIVFLRTDLYRQTAWGHGPYQFLIMDTFINKKCFGGRITLKMLTDSRCRFTHSVLRVTPSPPASDPIIFPLSRAVIKRKIDNTCSVLF